MKKKIKIPIIVLIAILILAIILIMIIPKGNDNFEIKIEMIDTYSPDRNIIVLKNGKEFNDYKHIKYKEKDIILCYSNNPVVNMYELSPS